MKRKGISFLDIFSFALGIKKLKIKFKKVRPLNVKKRNIDRTKNINQNNKVFFKKIIKLESMRKIRKNA